ncbi:putative actin binding protein [Heterostelium album PN500]|uniref:Putative actin binding protein n=1 Tax=Heterostelium pallidum (strain ATCC 26659 / Pp 5 / PN500) TaxID=670386 RepID=D3BQF2_HETP5|nr:putative actin binding protein [Heterostelium album PN500]EFA76372.1 putative actin binding protein [Heterostelium album PN500]|eukprot:XP_020428504.1 putative actin binding protein [Heterostelium album PN500]
MDFKSSIEAHKWTIIDKDLTILEHGNDINQLTKNCQSDNYFFVIIKTAGSLLLSGQKSIYTSYFLAFWVGNRVPKEKSTKVQDNLPAIIQNAIKYVRIEYVHHIFTSYDSEAKFYRNVDAARYIDAEYFDQLPTLKSQQWFVFGYNSERQVQSYQGNSVDNLQKVFNEHHSNVILFKKTDEEFVFIVWEGNLTRPIEKAKFPAFLSFIFLNFKDIHKKMKLVKYTSAEEFELLSNILKCSSPTLLDNRNNNLYLALSPNISNSIRPRLGKETTWATLRTTHLKSYESTPIRDFTSPIKTETKTRSSPSTPRFDSPVRIQFSPSKSQLIPNTPTPTPTPTITVGANTPSPVVVTAVANTNSNTPSPITDRIVMNDALIDSPLDSNLPKSVIDDVVYAGFDEIAHKVDLFNAGEINWILIGYCSSRCKSLTLLGTGNRGINEMKELLKDESTAFGVLKVNYTDTRSSDNKEVAVDSKRTKTIFIQWLGKKSKALEKARRNTHIKPVYNMFKQKTLVHGEIEADEFDDLSASTILQKVTSFRNDIQFKQIIEA